MPQMIVALLWPALLGFNAPTDPSNLHPHSIELLDTSLTHLPNTNPEIQIVSEAAADATVGAPNEPSGHVVGKASEHSQVVAMSIGGQTDDVTGNPNIRGEIEGAGGGEEAEWLTAERPYDAEAEKLCNNTLGSYVNGSCWYSSKRAGQTCNDLCWSLGGKFNMRASQHHGHDLGRKIYPGNSIGYEWESIECSSTDSSTNWGANGRLPDGDFTHKNCLLHCVCDHVTSKSIVLTSDSYSEQFLADGRVFLSSADLEFGHDSEWEQIFGIRFNGVRVPKDATVVRAEVQFQAQANSTGAPVMVRIWGEQHQMKGAWMFTGRPNDLTMRTRTQNFVDWNITEPWVRGDADDSHLTPNLAPIFNELFTSRVWTPGQSIVLLFQRSPLDPDRNFRIAESGKYAGTPAMSIDFIAPSCVNRLDPGQLHLISIRKICGSYYTAANVPAYHTAVNCATMKMDLPLAQALVNGMFKDCRSWCVYSDRHPSAIAWKWTPTGYDKPCWKQDKSCLSLAAEMQQMIQKHSTLCTDGRQTQLSGVSGSPFDRHMYTLQQQHSQHQFIIDYDDPSDVERSRFHTVARDRGVWYTNHSQRLEYRGTSWKSYRKLNYLGEGSFSVVYRGYKRSEPIEANSTEGGLALKYVTWPGDDYHGDRELKLLETLYGGPNIVQLYDIYTERRGRYPVLVTNYVHVQPRFSEFLLRSSDWEVRHYLYEMLRALDFTHSMGVIHKDIKPLNVVLDNKRHEVWLADWGSGDFHFPDVRRNTFFGTIQYKAPEMLLDKSDFDFSVDMWSFGATMATLIFQKYPMFSSDNDDAHFIKMVSFLGTKQIENLIATYSLRVSPKQARQLRAREFPPVTWAEHVTKSNVKYQSPEAWHLLDRLLVADPARRYTAREALGHPYFQAIRECWTHLPEANWNRTVGSKIPTPPPV